VKRLICFLLSMMVITASLPALAVEYTLPEKLQRQIDFGNGVRGTLKVSVEGEAEWVELLSPLNDVEIQVRSIAADGNFQHKLYTLNGEEQVGLTYVYGDEETLLVQSELLPDKVFSLSTGGDLLDKLLGEKDANPTWYSALTAIASVPETTWQGKWLPALEPYNGVNSAIELWLNEFASEPSIVKNEQGESVMLVRYDIPAGEVKEQIKAMLQQLFQDETLLSLLRGQLTDEQMNTYLNPGLTSYYSDVLDALSLTGTIVLERDMTTMGKILRTRIELPLPENEQGWTSFAMDEGDGVSTYTLKGQGEVRVKVEKTIPTNESDTFLGHVIIIPADAAEKAISAAYTLVRIHSTSVDADTRSHDITTWNLNLEHDLPDGAYADDYAAFEPIDVDLRLHYHSKDANYSPTTLGIDLKASFEGNRIALLYDLQTRSPWAMDELPMQGNVNMDDMTHEEQLQVVTDLALNGLVTLMAMQPQPIPMPQDEAPAAQPEALGEQPDEAAAQTPTDLYATPTDMPAVTQQP